MAAANEKQWHEFWQRLETDADALSVWRELMKAYTASWRVYHNLEHIGHCLAEFSSARQLIDNPVAVEAAIWFHDVIYDTGRKDNEERSADLASSVLSRAGQRNAFCREVHSLILATKHRSQPTSNDARLLTDIDLSILGQRPEPYAEFEQQIRHEYAGVADKDFAAGRSAILAGFLQRECIFSSPTFIHRYEQQARENLAWAIKRLTA